MKIAYLVMTHSNPRLLQRVVRTLSTENSEFFIHVDKKVDMDRFRDVHGPNVHFLDERVKVYWGDYSQVEATILLIRNALASEARYDYLVQLNASDYPIRSAAHIKSYFEENKGSEFIGLVRIPNIAAGKPLERINTIRYEERYRLRAWLMRVRGKIRLDQRDHSKYLRGMEPYAGNGWWALSRDACEYIDTFERNSPWFVDYFRKAFVPHESYFHTILGNSNYAPAIRRHLHYEDWSGGGASPTMLREGHIKDFEQKREVVVDDIWGKGELLFARKFSDASMRLLDRVDRMIEEKGD